MARQGEVPLDQPGAVDKPVGTPRRMDGGSGGAAASSRSTSVSSTMQCGRARRSSERRRTSLWRDLSLLISPRRASQEHSSGRVGSESSSRRPPIPRSESQQPTVQEDGSSGSDPLSEGSKLGEGSKLSECSSSCAILNRALDLDKMRLEESIGSGANGVVWRGTYAGTPVGVKVLHSHLVSSEVVARLRAEVELCMQLRHPHVVQTMGLAISADERRHGMVTELMDMNLAQYLADGRQSSASASADSVSAWEATLLDIASDVSKGMAYLHDRGVLHRDLKPANILIALQRGGSRSASQISTPPVSNPLGRRGHSIASSPALAKVCDMGDSVLQHGGVDGDNQHTLSMRGTPAYVAPEVLRNERYGTPADIFSFGALLCHMATRRPPYSKVAFGGLELMSRVAAGTLNPCADAMADAASPPDWPPAVRALASACCAADPDDRPTFERVLADKLLTTVPASPPTRATFGSRPRCTSILDFARGRSQMTRVTRSSSSARQSHAVRDFLGGGQSRCLSSTEVVIDETLTPQAQRAVSMLRQGSTQEM